MKPGRSGLRRMLRSVCRSTRDARCTLRSVHAHLSSKLNNLGVDRCDTMVSGHADAVVAIPDEVRLAYLVEAHSGQLNPLVVGAVHATPPLAHAPAVR